MNRARRRARRARWRARPAPWHRPPRAPEGAKRRRSIGWVPWLVATIALHAFVVTIPVRPAPAAPRTPVDIDFVATTEVEPAPIVDAPAPAPAPAPVAPKRAPKKRVVAKPKERVAPPPPTAPARPKRLVVGLSLASTVQGDGPAFAVGTTRDGTTADVAEAPSAAPAKTAVAVAPAPPRRAAVLEKPRRLVAREPDYPEAYRQRGLEARVTVEMTVGVDGHTRDIKLVAASEHDAFNDAAREAAARERFTPARRDGAPVPFVLRFTYHFRLST